MAATVFDHVTAQLTQGKEFGELFLENLEHIYEFDMTEIQDFILKHDAESDEVRRSNLINARTLLHRKLCEKFTSYVDRQLYNRRKVEMLVNDIYVIGFSVLNQMLDKRLSKVYKVLRGITPSQSHADDTLTGPLIDNEDLLQSTVELKATVSLLENTVKLLTEKVTSLTLKIDNMNNNINHDAAQVNTVQAAGSSGDNNRQPPGGGSGGSLPAANVILPAHRNSTEGQSGAPIPIPPPIPPNWPSVHSGHRPQQQQGMPGRSRLNSRSQGSGLNRGFQFQNDQRRNVRRGNTFSSNSGQQEVQGSATQPLRIQGSTMSHSQPNTPRSVYIGRLSENTTPDDIRAHLSDIGVSDLSDVISLNSNISGQASFCVVLDNETDENKVYDHTKWPSGVRVRPYRERSRSPRQAPHRNNNQYQNRMRKVYGGRNGSNSFIPLMDPRLSMWMPPMF